MSVAFTNFASTTIQGALTALGTSLTVATTTGANFPSTAGGAWFYIVLTDSLIAPTQREVIKVTARSGDNFSTLVRARDGTTALVWPSGTYCQLRLTAGTFADLSVQYANNADNLSNLASAATARTNLGLGSIATQAASAVAITGGTIAGVTSTGSAYNGTLGATTPSTVAATTISATGAFTSTLATGTAPFTVASTTVVGNLNVSQLLGATWTAPGTIGSGTPSSGAFTTLSASGAVSGVGFSNYLASPPAIGGSTPAAGTFTAIVGTTIRASTYINYRGGDNASATNSGFGETALDSNAGGTNNTAVGYTSLTSNTTGSNNTAVGYDTLTLNTTGGKNVAIGVSALHLNTTGNNNIAIGRNSETSNNTGNYNIGIGELALSGAVSGSTNVAIGDSSFPALGPIVNAGSFVVGVSYTIQTSGTTVFTAVGAANNNVGTIFTATGAGAGSGTASANTSFNVGVGSSSGLLVDLGQYNTAIGYSAGYTNTSGDSNTFLGALTKTNAATDTNSIVIGKGTTGLGSNTTIIGNSSTTRTKFYGSMECTGRTFGAQGAAVTAANNLTLGTDGNYFQVAGATQINILDNSSWAGGSQVTLKFNSTPTVKHNQGASGNFKPILLAGAVDFVATANDTLSLIYDSTDACWYETSRAVS